jgi:protein-S-isoprenylcysteine O-methyltransferase Ste14
MALEVLVESRVLTCGKTIVLESDVESIERILANQVLNEMNAITPFLIATPTQSLGVSKSARTARGLDFVEMMIVLGFYLGLVLRLLLWQGEHFNLANLLLLPSEGLVVVFLLLRRRTEQISLRWQDWALAMSATVAPLLVQPGVESPLVSPYWGAALLLMGLIIQVHAKLSLGRSFGCVPANRGLKFSGPYGFVRHPMYMGYLLAHLAFLLMNPTLWNCSIYIACYALQIPRLLNEERLLEHDQKYREYQRTVKYRLIPGLY